MARRGLRFITLAAIPMFAFGACNGNSATPTPVPHTTASASASQSATLAGPATVRWFVGLGSGVLQGQVDAEKAFVANYNSTNKDGITIKLEIVPNASAYDTLKSEMAAGNAPDIVGPVGFKGRNGFEGLFMDLAPEIAKNGYDMSGFDPTLVKFFQEGGEGQVGIPYDIFPGYIWYNKDIFTKAGLPDLPTKVGELYQGQTWDWTELGNVAAELTLDKGGRNATQAGFDPKSIVTYGIDFQWLDARRMASDFGPGSFVAADGKTAQIPSAWSDAFSWYYNAIWTGHYAPNGAAESSALLDQGDSQASGNVAMNAGWAWSISAIASDAKTAKVKKWDIAVVPSWKGTTTAGMDADTFTITKASKHPDQAFKAMAAIMADPTLMKDYGGEPAKTADQAGYFKAFDATLATVFPGNQVTWSVLGEMQKYPAVPSVEANMPDFAQASNDFGAFYLKLQNTAGLNVTKELANLKVTLQKDFDSVAPILSQ